MEKFGKSYEIISKTAQNRRYFHSPNCENKSRNLPVTIFINENSAFTD